MPIQTINVALVTQATTDLLKNDSTLQGVRIERAAVWDKEHDYQGFIGVYRESVRYPPRALGAGGGNRRQEVTLVLMFKQANVSSGADCEDELELLIQRAMSVLLNDNSFGGTVDTLSEEISIQYESYDADDSVFTQKAIAVITGIVNVSAYG